MPKISCKRTLQGDLVGKSGRRTGSCSGKCMKNPGRQASYPQIGDELQLQENEFNIANIIMPEITSNKHC